MATCTVLQHTRAVARNNNGNRMSYARIIQNELVLSTRYASSRHSYATVQYLRRHTTATTGICIMLAAMHTTVTTVTASELKSAHSGVAEKRKEMGK